jgi:L-lysine 6-oxidase
MGNAEYEFEVHPSIGVARVGDSTTEFYLAPESIGGRPIACDRQGNATLAGGVPVPVEHYKDARLRVKRQGARFRVVRYPKGDRSGPGVELTLDDPDVASLEWTVHVANKKAAWYNFAELLGDLYSRGSYDPTNSYAAKQVEPRNAGVTGSARQGLIIDPGPRTLTGARARAEFSRSTVPADYPRRSRAAAGRAGGPRRGTRSTRWARR